MCIKRKIAGLNFHIVRKNFLTKIIKTDVTVPKNIKFNKLKGCKINSFGKTNVTFCNKFNM